MAVLDLCCCVWAFPSSSRQGLRSTSGAWAPVAVAPLTSEHRLEACRLQSSQYVALVAPRHVESS